MSWTQTLEREIGYTYGSAMSLMRLVQDDELGWKPDTPEGAETTGWMTLGQLLDHMGSACGWMCEAFQTGAWKPVGSEGPPAKLPSASSVESAIEALLADRDKALAAVRAAGDERMETVLVMAPWGIEGTLGQQFLDSVKHLASHRAQLFYYLKLLGRPVHTGHLWGME